MSTRSNDPFTAAVNAAGQVMTSRQETASARNAANMAERAAAEAARAAAADAAMRETMAPKRSSWLVIGLPMIAIGAIATWWFFRRKR